MNTAEHIVKSFDDDLKRLEAMVAEMGGLVEEQIIDSVNALTQYDPDLISKVLKTDDRVDELEEKIDAAVVQVIALRQPKAQDLRGVVAILKVSSNLERIGDYAKNIAKRAKVLGTFETVGSAANVLRRMSRLVQEMLKDVLDAHGTRDIALADEVRARDESVDQLHNTLFRELLTYMMENPRHITGSMHLLFVAKNIERMGDHTTGIAEQVHYLIAGRLPKEDRPKSDVTSLTPLNANDADK
jgi:phosphate transport system protein